VWESLVVNLEYRPSSLFGEECLLAPIHSPLPGRLVGPSAGKAKTWYSFASFEVEGKWNMLTKKFCDKFFPISKVQH
jgi:hypothetical protein